MSRILFVSLLAFGCSVDTTGLLPAEDAGLRDADLPDSVGLEDAGRDAGRDAGECSIGESQPCESIGACMNRRQECVDGFWGPCIETVFAETAEVCDMGNVDEDCDGTSNEGCACSDGDTVPCGSDIGLCQMGVQRCVDGVISVECDGEVGPEAESCNGIDDNCNSEIDDGVLTTFFTDGDGDDFGTTPTMLACELPPGFALVGGDCNDGSAAVFPDNAELCDTLDNDCDTSIDEGVGTTYYLDQDEDNYGVSDDVLLSCDDPGANYVTVDGDCDDNDSDISPDASETCDLVDNNCSGTPDDGEVCRNGCIAHTYGGHVYQFCQENRNAGEAESRCDGFGGGYILVTIDDVAENTFLNDTARSIDAGRNWWIGLTDEGDEGNFRWLSGADVLYLDWNGGEPSNSGGMGGEDCVEMLGNGFWNDARCNSDRYYICEEVD